jgi:flagellar motor switch protein FliM
MSVQCPTLFNVFELNNNSNINKYGIIEINQNIAKNILNIISNKDYHKMYNDKSNNDEILEFFDELKNQQDIELTQLELDSLNEFNNLFINIIDNSWNIYKNNFILNDKNIENGFDILSKNNIDLSKKFRFKSFNSPNIKLNYINNDLYNEQNEIVVMCTFEIILPNIGSGLINICYPANYVKQIINKKEINNKQKILSDEFEIEVDTIIFEDKIKLSLLENLKIGDTLNFNKIVQKLYFRENKELYEKGK